MMLYTYDMSPIIVYAYLQLLERVVPSFLNTIDII